MSAKHTKGPWELRFRDGDRHVYSADGNSLMCDMQYYPWCPENDADWSLIAAAPDLLAALENIMLSVKNGHAAILTELIENASAAIARAKGEA